MEGRIKPSPERLTSYNFRRVMATGVLNYRPDHVLDYRKDCDGMARAMLDAAFIAILDEAGGLVGIKAIMREADRDIIA
jgi:hypothetical protein